LPGTPPVCDDGVACTLNACDEASDSCISTPIDCDDGQWCNGTESCDAVLRILDFVSGPVCHNQDGTEGICKQAEDIPIKGESVCDWSGEKRRCTWFGFQFDYENADPRIPIDCDYVRSQPSTEGNWKGVRDANVSTGSFSYELDSSDGHFYNPMFELYSIPPKGKTITIVTELKCKYGGDPVFDMTFRAHYSH
jgi:hypothetical protein